jgi:hypothetical protein
MEQMQGEENVVLLMERETPCPPSDPSKRRPLLGPTSHKGEAEWRHLWSASASRVTVLAEAFGKVRERGQTP